MQKEESRKQDRARMTGSKDVKEDLFQEKLVSLRRVTKVIKGGRKFSFSALMVVGDKKGSVGIGLGKAGDVAEAIRKGLFRAKKNMTRIALKPDLSLPYAMKYRYKGAIVMMQPASSGTGLIAGGATRALLESLGVQDIVSKNLGSSNDINVIKATFLALKSFVPLKTLCAQRGKKPSYYFGENYVRT